jgi:zinc protease
VGRANDQALAGILSTLRQENRTMAFEEEMDRKLEALTPESVAAALRKHIDASKLAVVVAGDFGNKTEALP